MKTVNYDFKEQVKVHREMAFDQSLKEWIEFHKLL